MKGRVHPIDADIAPHPVVNIPTPGTEAVQSFSQARGEHAAHKIPWSARAGLLAPLTVLSVFAAGYAHRSGRMPVGYTWESPFKILRDILAQPYTLSIFFAVFLIGRWRRRGSLDLLSLTEKYQSPVSLAELRAWRVPLCAALASVVIAVDAVVFEGHAPVDSLSLLCACVLAFYARPSISPLRVVGFVVFAAAIHTLSSYSFTVFKALTFVHQGPQDARILQWESALFGEPLHRAVARWAAAHPRSLHLADRAYLYLFEHMLLVSAFLVGTRQLRERNQYLAAVTLCSLLGGPLYHLLPGYGPLWHDPESYRHLVHHQLRVNGLAETLYCNRIRLHTTPRGVLYTYMYIACMPSLHMAHETLMLWYARHSRLALTLSLASWVLTAFATMALGWHYFLDLVFGALFAVGLVVLCRWGGSRWFPAALDAADQPLPPRPAWRDWRDRLLRPTPTSPAIHHPSPTNLQV